MIREAWLTVNTRIPSLNSPWMRQASIENSSDIPIDSYRLAAMRIFMVFSHAIDRQSRTLKPSSNAAWAWRIGITVDHSLPSRTLAARNCWSRPLSGSIGIRPDLNLLSPDPVRSGRTSFCTSPAPVRSGRTWKTWIRCTPRFLRVFCLF
jgi:hypothetical protein